MQHPKATSIQLDVTASLQKWRAFLAIGELGSLTRAALFLNSNQSLLSRQLNALERECGTRLFVRTGRGVELSDVGQRIFPQVRALLPTPSNWKARSASRRATPAAVSRWAPCRPSATIWWGSSSPRCGPAIRAST